MTPSYDELVAAATVGITRRPVSGLVGATGSTGAPDGDDPAAALLDAAALLTVARRAGVQPRHEVTVPALPADVAPALSDRAVGAFRALCWPGGYWRRDQPFPKAEYLAELLNAAADAGYLATGELLTDLLDVAITTPVARPAIARVLGARGHWFAWHRPEWRDALALTAVPEPSPGLKFWRDGAMDERVAYLSGLRHRDPAGARDLLAAVWDQEHGRDRARLIAVLWDGLSPDDEEFLERALKDRAATVHDQAVDMLAWLPGTAFRRRGSERAAGLLRLDAEGPIPAVTVTLPGKLPPGSARDGVTAKPPSPAIRTEAWWLIQLLARAPLSDWTQRFRLSPAEIAALPVAGGLGADVHAGWRLAAVAQEDAEWLRALLAAPPPDGVGGRPAEAWPQDHQLLAALPLGEWATTVLADVDMAYPRNVSTSPYSYRMSERDQFTDARLSDLASCPLPWPSAFADAVIEAFDRSGAGLEKPRLGFSSLYLRRPADALLSAAGRRMPIAGDRDYAAELTRLVSSTPFRQTGFHLAAQAITHRRAFYEEISCPSS